ncbi:MAG: outer membrane protein assembly factor [Deltaproteobacteria bacterium]|nr:MAG: outer membrane protein assembly factor [Deltaproteobacteria bacterium]
MGVRLISALALLLASLAPTAHAQSSEDLAGLPIADVQLVAPDGGLPEESLESLLRARAGDPLSLYAVRTDLATLMRVGEFSAVEADAERWFTQNAEGELRPATLLTYTVWPAPHVEGLNIAGNDALPEREVRAELGVERGDVFYEELNAPQAAARLLRRYEAEGYPRARVDVLASPTEEGVVVDVLIDEGAPRKLSKLFFTGKLPVDEKRLRRWARREGLREGKNVALSDVTAAQRFIRERLARHDALRPEESGWVQARVTPAWAEEGDDLVVTFSVEPGARLALEVTGIAWRPRSKVRQALGIDERTRLTRGFLESAPERIASDLARRGFYEATADVTLDNDGGEATDVQTLRVAAVRGRKHVLRGDLPWRERGVHFAGNDHVDATSLRTVMEQASPDVLRLGRVTDAELEVALAAAEKLYQSRGYLDAKLRLENLRVRRRRFPRSLLDVVSRQFAWATERVLVDLDITVHEGRLTTLASLEVIDSAVELPWLEDVRTNVEAAPYSPQALELLARRIVADHRAGGFLEADARVVSRLVDGTSYRAAIEVQPGDQILLRSVVTRGMRRTRSRFLRREVDLELGAPITASDLEQVRRRLVDLGTFRSVDLALLGDEPGRDLLITLEERPIHAYEVGGGASTDLGIRAFGRYTRHNLWGRAHRLDAFGSLGVQYASDSLSDWRLDLGKGTEPQWRSGITYTAPRFPLRGQRVVVDLLLRERRFERTFEMGQFGVSTGLITALPTRTQIRLGARLERRRLQEADSGALLPGEVWTGLFSPDTQALTSWRTQDSLEAIVLQDWRDDPLAPSRGAVVRLLGQIAPGGAGLAPNSVSFLKTEARVSSWIPLLGATLRITAEGGHAFMLDGGLLPLEDRYRLGGTGSLRGFRRDAIGPRRQVSQVDLDWPSGLEPVVAEAIRARPTRWVPVGGDTRALGVFELVLPLPVLGMPSWDGYAFSLFTDIGNVWLVRGRELAQSQSDAIKQRFDAPLRSSVGAGLSIQTPVGPLGVDLAANLQSLTATGDTRTLLRKDWEEPPLRVHLSLGALQ